MDDVDRLIQAFQAPRAQSSAAWKLDALLDSQGMRDPRIVPFLLQVMADRLETTAVRIAALKRLRDISLKPNVLIADDRCRIADEMIQLLTESRTTELRLQAALALAEFTDVKHVLAALTTVALEPDQPIDLRYCAFTSLQRAGPTMESFGLLQQLASDETLGPSAQSLLLAWRLA